MSEIVNVPSQVLENLQADSKAIRELLEKQDLEARNKEQEAIKKAESDAILKAEKDSQQKIVNDQILVEKEEQQKIKNEEQAQKDLAEKEFKSSLINGVTGTNEKLDSMITYQTESDGDTELKNISKKLDSIVTRVETQENFQADYGGYTIFASGLFIFLATVILPLCLGYVFVIKPFTKKINYMIFK